MPHSDEVVEQFIEYVMARYGSQIFKVKPSELHLALLDLDAEMDHLGLFWRVPSSIDTSQEAATGEVELIVHPTFTSEFWTVGVFAIFPEE